MSDTPAGMIAARVHVIVVTEVGPLTVLVRPAALPPGIQPLFVKFPDIAPHKQLPVLGDLGVAPNWQVKVTEWDFGANRLELYLVPTRASARLSEESMAMVTGLYRQAGWDYLDEKAKGWPERLAAQKKLIEQGGPGHGHAPDCPNHPANQPQPQPQPQAQGGVPLDLSGVNIGDLIGGIFAEPDELDDELAEPEPPRRKRRKRKKNPGGKKDGGEEGAAGAGGDEG